MIEYKEKLCIFIYSSNAFIWILTINTHISLHSIKLFIFKEALTYRQHNLIDINVN
jgi:hypothetical protein